MMMRSGISFSEVLPVSWWGWVGVEMFFVISGYVIASTADNRKRFGIKTVFVSNSFAARQESSSPQKR
jgi:peptidoglycan/LPS O-acetylase OafA/YrhL